MPAYRRRIRLARILIEEASHALINSAFAHGWR